MKHFKVGGLALLALGLCVGCEKKDEAADPNNSGVAGSSAGVGGTAPMPASTPGAGGADPDEVRKGERGSSCDSTIDCEDDLTCIVTSACPAGVACANKTCQPSNFNLTGTGKSCQVSDCKAKIDCCGDKPLQAPAKCADRKLICGSPTLAGCTTTSCTSATADICGKGACSGRCSYDSLFCRENADCAANTCDPLTGLCKMTGGSCSSDLPCPTVDNTCSLAVQYCDCANKKYKPDSAICADEDCEDVCGLTCKEDRCVVDDSCGSDDDCPETAHFCNAGVCGQCKTSTDCKDEMCINGHCGPSCKTDTQCPTFEACQAGECVYVGCRTDRECVLQARTGAAAPSQDPRLAKCHIAKDIGTCVLPCDIDAQCAPTEICHEGICTYIGCETDGECKTIAGLHDLPLPTPDRPWTTTAVCKPEGTAAP